MSYHYYASLQNSTAVIGCVSGNFSSATHLNLIVARNSQLDFYLVCPEGLTLLQEIHIYGRIEIMKSYRAEESKDLLFIVTSKCDAFILEFKLEDSKLHVHTKAHGNISDKYGQDPETGKIAVIDPCFKVIALRVTEGLLKIIPLEDGPELKAVNLRLSEQDVRDFGFLHGYPKPTMIFLYSDNNACHIKTAQLSLKDKEFTGSVWKQEHVENDSSIIITIPEPLGGVILIGKETILYHNGASFIAVAPPLLKKSQIVCYARVDATGYRHVLGDMIGNIFMLFLETDLEGHTGVKDVKLELLGEISAPESICYLDNGVLFVGSRLGDSQLIKLNKLMDPETGSYISVLDTFVNLAPIVDMVVVNIDNKPQHQLVTCSGAGKDGSLRIIKNGITAQELATIDLEGIIGIWPLSLRSKLNTHDTLVLSFASHTKILAITGEEVEETELCGFIPNQRTLHCDQMENSMVISISEKSVQLISIHPNEEVLDEWMPPLSQNIDIAASNEGDIVCAVGKIVYYLEINFNTIHKKSESVMTNEVACMDIFPPINPNRKKYVAVGLWNNISIRILILPSLDEVSYKDIEGEIIPRSIKFGYFEGLSYVFCGLGNGSLVYFSFNVDDGSLFEKKLLSVGTQPIILKSFQSSDSSVLFACSDLPSVIYSFSRKIIFPYVNVPRIVTMCSLNSDGFPNCVALVTDYAIKIASMNEFQKLHIRSIPLDESPKRIAFQEYSQTLGVICMRTELLESKPTSISKQEPASLRAPIKTQSQSSIRAAPIPTQAYDNEVEIYSFLLLDVDTFNVLHSHQMLPNEFCLSLMSVTLGKDKVPYYVIGTAIIDPEECEPKRGRIIVLQVKDGRVTEVAEELTKGACYSLNELNGKVVAGIGSHVRLYEWTEEMDLRLECFYSNNVLALYLKVKGDFVLIGDVMRSMTLIQYKSVQGTFDEICRDFSPAWMTAIEILDDETFIGAENSLNLFTCRKNSTSVKDEERERLEIEGIFHLGDLVNVIRKGSIAIPIEDVLHKPKPVNYLLGTVSGCLGVLLPLPKYTYDILTDLESKLAFHIKSVGNIPHKHWRASTRVPQLDECPTNFIDGDLVETFIDLPYQDKSEVVIGIKKPDSNEDITIEEVVKIVEELSRLH